MMSVAGTLVLALMVQNPGSASEANGKTPPAPTAPAPSAPPADQPFKRLIPNLIDDAKRLPSSETLLLLLGGTAGSAIAGAQDRSGAKWATLAGGRTDTSRFGAAAGEGWVQASAAFGTYALGRLTGKSAVTHVGSDLIRAQVLNGLITTSLKHAVGRTRPNGGPYSFPSGHTSASFTTAAVLHRHFGWKAGVPVFALASVIGWSRVRDHVHWSSDIVSGATLGAIVGFATTRGHGPRNWVVTPAPTAGGFAIYVAKIPIGDR
jgi:membrane-associated phospholipid phosphatase